MKNRLSTNGILGAAGVVYAAAEAVVVLVSNFPAALATLVISGMAWMAVTSTLQAELQLVLPTWVRARGVAIYTVNFMGSMTVGAILWGLVANRIGLQPAVLLAASVVLVAAGAGLLWRVPETGHLDPQAAVYWPEAQLAFDPQPDAGPVLVTVHYTVAPEQQPAFLRPWSSSANLDSALERRGGSCTETAMDRTDSSSFFASPPGRNTSGSTRAA